jgi:hypothetical protein
VHISNDQKLLFNVFVDDGDGGGSTQERVHKPEKSVNPQKLFSLQF